MARPCLVVPLLLVGLSVAGCSSLVPVAAPQPANVQKAAKTGSVPQQRLVSGVPEQVRQRLGRKLKSSRFRLDSAQDTALRVSLQADPQRYVDCGDVVVPAGAGRPASRFPAALASHSYLLPLNQRVYGVTRKLQLQASAELELQPQSTAQTLVAVRVVYLLKRQQKAVADGVTPIQTSDELQFAGGESATFPNAPTRCAANGRLEDELLDLAG